MIRDPIVDEIHAIRDQIATECNHDVNQLFALYRRLEAASGAQTVTLAARRPRRSREGAGQVDDDRRVAG